MIILFITLFGLRGRGAFGMAEPAVFIMAGFLPFLTLFVANYRGLMSAPNTARRYLLFRQVQLLDIILVKCLTQIVIFFCLLPIITIAFLWLGFSPLPANPLEVIGWGSVLWLYGAAFGLIMMYLAAIAPDLAGFMGFLSMPLKFLSALFYPMTLIPDPYRTWLAYNPLVHVNELIRENWFAEYISPVADPMYVLWWAAFLLAWGFMLLRLKWQGAELKSA